MSEFTIIDRVLSMYYTIYRARSLYKLMSNYLEIGVFRTRYFSFGKVSIFFTIFAKILNLWEGSTYVLGFKYVRVLNISKFS